MSNPIQSSTSTSSARSVLNEFRPPSTDPEAGELDKDAFLKLLVAQLKYQDPLQPSTNEDFIATTAQFTTVEKLDELAKQGANTALVNSLATAGALVGKQVSTIEDGVTTTSTVLRSQISDGSVVLVTDNGRVPLNEVTAIGTAAPPTPPA